MFVDMFVFLDGVRPLTWFYVLAGINFMAPLIFGYSDSWNDINYRDRESLIGDCGGPVLLILTISTIFGGIFLLNSGCQKILALVFPVLFNVGYMLGSRIFCGFFKPFWDTDRPRVELLKSDVTNFIKKAIIFETCYLFLFFTLSFLSSAV